MNFDVDFETFGYDGQLLGTKVRHVTTAIGGEESDELALERGVMVFVAVEDGCGVVNVAEGSQSVDLGVDVLRRDWVRGGAVLPLRSLVRLVSACLVVMV